MSVLGEIEEQPEALSRLLDAEDRRLVALGAEVRRRLPSHVVIAARGTSDHAALYAQYLLQVRTGWPVMLAIPSAMTMYGARLRFEDALVVGVSQSGQSPDIVGVVEAARYQGATTIAITNDADSPLARASHYVVELHAGPEHAIAATKTYTTALGAIAALSVGLGDPDRAQKDLAALRRVPEMIRRALLSAAAAADAAGRVARVEGSGRAIVLGRGFEYATAREWALKLQELGNIFALPFSTADFEHGPRALVEPDLAVLVVDPLGPGHADRLALLGRLREAGALTVVITDDSSTPRQGVLRLEPGTPLWLGPMVSIVPAQLFTYHLARARGLDPDRPRSIKKVTLTR